MGKQNPFKVVKLFEEKIQVEIECFYILTLMKSRSVEMWRSIFKCKLAMCNLDENIDCLLYRCEIYLV